MFSYLFKTYLMSLTLFENVFAQLPYIISKEGEICGGAMYISPSIIHDCEDLLECVYTNGPITDSPGICHVKCPIFRDDWGNCIPENCETWFDGCNTCSVVENHLIDCTEINCLNPISESKCESYSTKSPLDTFIHCSSWINHMDEMNRVCCANEKDGNCVSNFPKKCSSECASIVNVLFNDCGGILDYVGLSSNSEYLDFVNKCKLNDKNSLTNDVIPDNCAIWFDGCNTCQISDKGNLCTKMMCMNQQPSVCKRYYIPEELSTDKHEIGRQCFDGKDNDKDGKKDCLDPDCAIYGVCRIISNNGVKRLCFSDRNNNTIDCNNPECKKDPRASNHCKHINTETGRECFDNIDNDNDDTIDCEDTDCKKDPRASWRCNTEGRGRGRDEIERGRGN